MKIAIFSELDKDAHEGALQLLTRYANKSPEVIFPVSEDNQQFATSVGNLCKQLGIRTTAYCSHEFSLADEVEYADDEVVAVLHQLEKGDAIGILWRDSEYDHFVLHSVEDLALDVWDITKGLSAIEHSSLGPLDPDALRDAMMDSFEEFVDLMATYVAATVLSSITQAVEENIRDMVDKKDISPFDEEQ
jgi:hypothetical protein